MLQGQVEVRHACGQDRRDQFVGEVRRVEVEQPHPGHDLARRLHQRHEPPLAATPVPAVGGQVLSHKNNLRDTQGLDLGKDRSGRARALRSPETGDGAVATAPVAALGDLHVGPGRPRRWAGQVQEIHAWQVDLGARRQPPAPPPRRPEADRLTETGHSIDGRAILTQFGPDPLREAARHHEARSRPPASRQVVDRLQRLAPGVGDEGARVHHDEVRLGGILGRPVAVGGESPGDLVGVDLVLGAAQSLQPVPPRHDI